MFQLVWKVVLPIVWRTPDFVWWLKILHLALFISVMHYAVVFEHSYRGEQSAADFKLDDGSFLLFSFPVKRHKIWFYICLQSLGGALLHWILEEYELLLRWSLLLHGFYLQDGTLHGSKSWILVFFHQLLWILVLFRQSCLCLAVVLCRIMPSLISSGLGWFNIFHFPWPEISSGSCFWLRGSCFLAYHVIV